MVRRICPTCDQVMSSAHYCGTCRKWVKNPWVREVTYYLNERHPAVEADCTYHTAEQNRASDAAWKQRAMQGHNPAAGSKVPTVPGGQPAWMQRTTQSGSAAANRPSMTSAQNAKKSETKWSMGEIPKGRAGENAIGLTILIIFLILKLLSTFIRALFH